MAGVGRPYASDGYRQEAPESDVEGEPRFAAQGELVLHGLDRLLDTGIHIPRGW